MCILQEHAMVAFAVLNTTIAPHSDDIYVTMNVEFVPSICTKLQDNKNYFLNSTMILLVYDLASVFNIGKFEI